MTVPRGSEEQQEIAGKKASIRLYKVLYSSFIMSKEEAMKGVFDDDRVRVNKERPKNESQEELFEGNKVDLVRGYKGDSHNRKEIDIWRVKIIKNEDHADKREEDSDNKALDDDDDKKQKSKITVKPSTPEGLTIKNYDPEWKGSYRNYKIKSKL